MASGRSTSRWTSASWVWPPRPVLRAASGRGRCSWPWKQVESTGRAGDVWEDGEKKTGEKIALRCRTDKNFSVSEEISLLQSLALLQVKGQRPIFPSHFECDQKSSVHHHFDCGIEEGFAAVVVLKDCLFTLWLTVPETYESWKLEVRQLWIDQSITKSARNQLWFWRFYSSKFHLATWLLQDFILIPVSLFVLCKVRW